MLKQVLVPDLGDFEQIDIIELLVAPGARVTAEDPLIMLESEKAAIEIPSPYSGTVKELNVALGDKVSKGDLILTLELEGAETEDTTKATTASPTPPAHDAASASAPQNAGTKPVLVPDLGDFEQIDIIEVMVAPGSQVTAEDPLIMLESEKAAIEIPSPYSGTVKELLVGTGDKVSEGDQILTMEVAAGPVKTEQKPAPVAAAEPEPVPAAEKRAGDKEQAPPPVPPTPENGRSRHNPHASPAVRRISRELGVDLTQVKGSGPRGRILKEDVQVYVKAAMAKQKSGPGPGLILPETPAVDFSIFGEIETQPLSKIKAISGAHLHSSWLKVPHVTQFDEADITELEAFRKEHAQEAKQQGFRLTLLAFMIKACVMALRKFPQFNSSLDPGGENLILKRYYNIGFAVDTPAGLVVPVIKNVEQKGLFDLAQELEQLSGKARDRRLGKSDMEGGTFTISSLGGIGGTGFTPIVNTPEVAILGVARAAIKPVYIDGEFMPRLVLPFSLSYDHRVIDGADGARFTSHLSTELSDIRKLLL
jgi:pyruvate dehydrogenase E2 component (dihydrolipoamide acetyltransferase)